MIKARTRDDAEILERLKLSGLTVEEYEQLIALPEHILWVLVKAMKSNDIEAIINRVYYQIKDAIDIECDPVIKISESKIRAIIEDN